MRRIKIKSIVGIGFAMAAAFVAEPFISTVNFAGAEEENVKTIDLYLIGGQSNAAGYSPKGDLNETFSNVTYAGQVNLSRTGANAGIAAQDLIRADDWKPAVTAGLGRSAGHIGPEYGIAKILNGAYSAESPAMIFKSAAGGTRLMNIQSGQSNDFGNWYPRSLWGAEAADTAISAKGVQYSNFIENFRSVYTSLVTQGYTPKIKGMAWMQGESDLGNHEEYKTLLKTFISDIRNDLQTITSDESIKEMPFVIGEIASSYLQYNNPNVPPFVEVQRDVAVNLDHVYTVQTDDLTIVKSDGTYGGPDQHHFGTKDAVTLGERFGTALAVAAGKAPEGTQLGSVTTQILKGEGNIVFDTNAEQTHVTFSVTANEGYTLTALRVDGKDVTEKLSSNTYRTVWRRNMTVSAVFLPVPKLRCSIAYAAYDKKMGTVTGTTVLTEGDTLAVAVTAKDGYEIERVTFSGRDMTFDVQSGKYLYPNVTGNGTVSVTFRDGKNGLSNRSDAWVVPVSVCGGVLVLGGAAAATVLGLKKKKGKSSPKPEGGEK